MLAFAFALPAFGDSAPVNGLHGAIAPDRGVRACATCHSAQAKPHPGTSMAHAMEAVSETSILKARPLLTTQIGAYSYKIERRGDQSIYSVSNGEQTLTVPIGWIFGLGDAGQTYIFEKDGSLFESRVSYFRELDGLDLTIGAANLTPVNLLQAAGREMGKRDAAQCFNCHTTNGVEGLNLKLAGLTPGVQCERCHGPSENHLKGLKTGDAKLAAMNKLGELPTEQMSNFCGQCHRTWEEIAVSGKLGIANVRFQPYRLTNSKCYDAEDSRISCVSCHNPHQEVSHVDAGFDRYCLACHSAGGKAGAKLCRTAQSNCVSCHMPKLAMPGSHHRFTDHQIRIVRANEKYPD